MLSTFILIKGIPIDKYSWIEFFFFVTFLGFDRRQTKNNELEYKHKEKQLLERIVRLNF